MGGPDFVGGEEVGVLSDELLEVKDGGGDVGEVRWVSGGFDLGGDGFLRIVEAREENGGGGDLRYRTITVIAFFSPYRRQSSPSPVTTVSDF
ncbi:hypothetical protein Q3G72_024356 [Acer saccharum]|nr:hypothetical protein Q3G72_024356 [Acer saccharum]